MLMATTPARWFKSHSIHSNHKDIHSDTEQIRTRGPQNEYPYDFIGKSLKNIPEFSSATASAGQSEVAKLSGAHRAQRSDPHIPHARDTVWAGIGNLVDLHQGERKPTMVDLVRLSRRL
tara:strand:+ start:412 stop:768 length:357 start_codon:yes stop_codon:yes gene_type:complete